MKKLVIAIFAVLVLFVIYTFTKSNPRGELSLVMVAFGSQDDEGRWRGEVAPYMEKLENRHDISSQVPMCEKVFQGELNHQPVLLVVSGMGKVNATSCAQNLLSYKGNEIREIIFSGIAGITPMKGGMLTPEGYLRKDSYTVIGDVCINSVAFDFDLQHYSSDESGSTLNSPVFWSFETTYSSDNIYFKPDLANELADSVKETSWPEPPDQVVSINTKYHGISRSPKLLGRNECLEATGDLFWHDTSADARAREMGAIVLSESFDQNLSAEDIVVMTAMEALPVGLMVSRWNESNGEDIAFAYVRSASNFDHSWLNPNGTPAVSGEESRQESGRGYDFAIQTQALPVLKMFELRSKE